MRVVQVLTERQKCNELNECRTDMTSELIDRLLI